MLFALPVHQKQMVAFGLATDVDIFSHFDITFGAKNDRPAVSPGAQTSRSQPIHPKIRSRTIVRDQRSVTEILKFRVLFIRIIGYARRSDAGIGGSGEEKELFDLMAADIAQDAAVLRSFEKPGRPALALRR